MRLTVVAKVHTEAINVSNFTECSRFLGSLAKVTCVSGTVVEVLLDEDKASRNKTSLRVRWACLGRQVEKTLALRSVRAALLHGPGPTSGLKVGSPVTQGSQPVAPESQSVLPDQLLHQAPLV